MKKADVVTLLIIITVVAVGASGFAVIRRMMQSTSTGSPIITPGQTDTDNNHDGIGETVTKAGVIGCLEPKDTTGPHSDICATGIKTADGASYALGSDDPVVTGSIAGGSHVQVTGTLTRPTTAYDAAGLIQVTAITKLQ